MRSLPHAAYEVKKLEMKPPWRPSKCFFCKDKLDDMDRTSVKTGRFPMKRSDGTCADSGLSVIVATCSMCKEERIN